MRIWVLRSYRAGMNTQILGLADALDRPYALKRLQYRPGWAGWWPAYLCRSTLAGIDVDASSVLEPPWPDLILTAGRRHEPVCRWIRARSGGRTKIVFLGRTWADPTCFDLVATTPQYRLAAGPHVLVNPTTMHGVTAARLGRAAECWHPQLDALPRPRIAVLVGGTSGPFSFGPIAARRLARRVSALAGQQGGSLMVTTSARTSPAATTALEAALSTDSTGVPTLFHRYTPDDDANPYLGFLAVADAIVVTGDSIAMISEALATGKKVLLFDLATGRRSMRGEGASDDGVGVDADAGPDDFELRCLRFRWLMRLGARRLTRDITLVHRPLVASGRAAWLGNEPPVVELADPVASVPRDEVVQSTVRHVLALVET